MILGIDEVGRGPWAGPLVIGAVVLGGAQIEGLTDSKKLSKKRREQLNILIRDQAAGYGLGWVSAAEIDQIGLSESLRLATRRAVEQIKVSYHEIIIDGTINFLDGTSKGQYVTTMKKADLLVPSASAASIIAKVARDSYMAEQDDAYPGYKFSSHVGYGTAVHRAAIDKLGVTPLHRLSFAPLAKYKAPVSIDRSTNLADKATETVSTETTKKIGDRAEDEAANYLVRHGHEILERNWKTKYCEIDIVSLKSGTLYFTEVKYRKSADQGGGIAAITKKKLSQMKFAANYFVQAQQITEPDLLLAVISMTGNPPDVEEFIELK
ncbi:ribonuclease HII [Candidatus Saccharibacteria bacterium RIFCSPHIGHO2_01_FULL_45_15]|nr:MAG: ribonuclease HII [Candidatus Saccharibacteria bacterium RIFCSPHIGHO2_01_FULL_45_15]OGL28809.1 MAG: ribonuclease HII [Candidatus Saccharibacteria bacterium RIFCSPHIGHO2_02_FULL_46_12]OGL31696.1 MAG: ribonuclease HII [Candidatus Saccharibacteria bacterium RIFCSPHIGHO2_12_FULL_44_22]